MTIFHLNLFAYQASLVMNAFEQLSEEAYQLLHKAYECHPSKDGTGEKALETLRGYLKEQKFEKSKNRVLITAGISATRLDGTRLLRKMKVCYERLAHFTDTMRDMFNHHTSQCSSVKNAQALNEIVCRWNKKIDRCKDFEKRAAKVYRVGDESTVFVHLKMRMVEAARAANGLVNTTPTTVTEAFKIIT